MKQKPTDEKSELRRTYRELRLALGEDARAAADAAIAQRVAALNQFRNADIVFTYLSFGEEVDTRALIEEAWSLGKTVVLPRVTGKREMRWFEVASFDGLETSRYGIDEPPLDETREMLPQALDDSLDDNGDNNGGGGTLDDNGDNDSLDDNGDNNGGGGTLDNNGGNGSARAIAIVPALSFDAQGYRLGYGGGFYDVFLSCFAGTSVGLCRACQLSREPLPHDAHDIPVDLVVSETDVRRR